MAIDKTIRNSTFLLTIMGSGFLILGITLILVWWPAVVAFFRGGLGILISLGGLFLLYMAKE